MRVVDIIDKKKKGISLTNKEIDFLLDSYFNEEIADYQMSAFLMAVYFKGMSDEELAYFTLKMRNSGDIITFENINKFLVDKHSTGGVGDKVTIVLSPILAALGMATTKLSGKGLSHTGGTIDKFSAIEDFKFSSTKEELVEIANKTGIGLMGYSDSIVPLDKKIYALRDVTSTVDSIPLIASSIMSKKLAIESDIIILDVKVGDGAFMKTVEDAKKLSNTMVVIGNSLGRKTIAMITNMEEPLGYAVGNSNELLEAIEALKGNWPNDLKEVVYEIIFQVLKYKKEVKTKIESDKIIDELINSGKALEVFRKFLYHSGVRKNIIDDYKNLPVAKYKFEILSNKSGYIHKIKAENIGKVAMIIGAGREKKEDNIDYSVGILLHKKVGDYVNEGEILAEICYNDKLKLDTSKSLVMDSYIIDNKEKKNLKTIIDIIE
ncbi:MULTISPECIES: thymidine phosphorylase [unclassified Gemella]|uniref:thymidine phosphorylase n=1 Tax=unclassified Gemella TaxID=2624949 RepID=UPI001C0587EB|nr:MULTISPECIES: thymidine phosphorylase [unclassified Gemella]MBU0278111.1 thymidine phosphorylase [Gemella sp. zg-1178]QWQ38364.1 thymidine phosphorylase [Gemella sp. zg-570]